jgi:2-oxoglutarate dehydrogenase E2 component (dihydrolipoamide succinyltransferase)
VKQEVKIPSVGESVTQGILSSWLKAEGEKVEEGSDLLELETDKATVTVPSPATGVLAISVAAGAEVTIGQVVGTVDTKAASPSASAPKSAGPALKGTESAAGPALKGTESAAGPALKGTKSAAGPAPQPQAPPAQHSAPAPVAEKASAPPVAQTPLSAAAPAPVPRPAAPPRAGEQRTPMSTLRKHIAEKLVEAQHATASLTTFNEVNMQKISDLRGRYRDEFERAHGVKLGFMSFFVKACCLALAEMPIVNSRIEAGEIVTRASIDIGVAVSTERGLLVPVIRNAAPLGLAALEAAIADLAARGRDRTILPDELAGGTFSITNGGVFGSLLSTPLLNYPQSAILGMHTIQRRPIAETGPDGKSELIVVRPMMYLALTYDHRLIDGKEAVSFLKRVKELVEDPWRLFIEA